MFSENAYMQLLLYFRNEMEKPNPQTFFFTGTSLTFIKVHNTLFGTRGKYGNSQLGIGNFRFFPVVCVRNYWMIQMNVNTF